MTFMYLERKTKEEGRHHWNNNHKMPFAELFDNDRQILYMGLQKKAESPTITAFRSKVNIKYELRLKTNSKDKFNKRWTLSLGNVPL